jgi:hypothetical protein
MIGNFSLLPNEILLYLFSLCDSRSLIKLSRVCKTFNILAFTEYIWINKTITIYSVKNGYSKVLEHPLYRIFRILKLPYDLSNVDWNDIGLVHYFYRYSGTVGYFGCNKCGYTVFTQNSFCKRCRKRNAERYTINMWIIVNAAAVAIWYAIKK